MSETGDDVSTVESNPDGILAEDDFSVSANDSSSGGAADVPSADNSSTAIGTASANFSTAAANVTAASSSSAAAKVISSSSSSAGAVKVISSSSAGAVNVSAASSSSASAISNDVREKEETEPELKEAKEKKRLTKALLECDKQIQKLDNRLMKLHDGEVSLTAHLILILLNLIFFRDEAAVIVNFNRRHILYFSNRLIKRMTMIWEMRPIWPSNWRLRSD